MNFPPDTKTYFDIVWTIVRQIPSGVVSTYGQIASMIPAPTGVDEADYERLGAVWVGKAMNAVSSADDTDIPWQRVINSQGGISLPEGSKAALEQRRRLENEGVKFSSAGKINLNTFAWDGPTSDWLSEYRLLTPKALKKPADDKPGQMRLF
ncbi:MAG: 6-O-methylguanine DNA methyltransferase [Anaerolineaceae bacterium]|nr:6-O-methylguanine DNA methyltransferase [Anaerolineaceae bacterium]